MKKIFTITSLLIAINIYAQVPEKMSYQAVVRNSNDELVTLSNIGMQISVLQGSLTGVSVCTETQTPTTNTNGLLSIEIGTGTVISGAFSNINWSNGPYFIKTEIDLSGGTNYTITGTSQMMSVPYALYAKRANFVSQVCPEDSIGLYTELTNPVVIPDVIRLAVPGVVDNRYYRYKYLLKKNDTWTKLSSESQSVQVIDNSQEGKIKFSVQIPNDKDVDSIAVYRQFSVDNIVFGIFSHVTTYPVSPNQLFTFIDNNDNFKVLSNPQPPQDINNTMLKGNLRTDLLTKNREYQLPDESGVLFLLENLNKIKVFNPLEGVNKIIDFQNLMVAQITIGGNDENREITYSFSFTTPINIVGIGIPLNENSICGSCPLSGTIASPCSEFSSYKATGAILRYRIIKNGSVVHSSQNFGSASISELSNINTFYGTGCSIEVDYQFQRTKLPQSSSTCLKSLNIEIGVLGEKPLENILYYQD